MHKEVARNAPALHSGPLAFFYEKSLAKKLFICLGSSFFPLFLLLVRGSRLCCSLFWYRCVYRKKASDGYSFYFLHYFASEKRIPGKWRRQACGLDSTAMYFRLAIATDRLACPRSASPHSCTFFSCRIKRSMWTLYQACADRSTSQVYL